MAISLIQTATPTATTGTSRTITWGSDTTTGNFIFVGVWVGVGTANQVSSITDDQSNTYQKAISQSDGGFFSEEEIWYAENITGGTTPVITVNLTSHQVIVFAREYSGIALSGSLDKTAGKQNSALSTIVSGLTATTTTANELLIGIGSTGSGHITGANGSFGNFLQSTLVGVRAPAIEDRIVAATGTYQSSFSVSPSDSGPVAVATFAGASSTDDNITVSDTITDTDTLRGYSDTVFTREQVTVQVVSVGDLSVNVSDTTTTSESLKLLLNSNINVSDTTTTSENIGILSSSLISVQDTTTTSESIGRLLTSFINKSDTVTSTESVSISPLGAVFTISVSDTVTTSESIKLLIPTLLIKVSDTTTTSEAIQLLSVTPAVFTTLSLDPNHSISLSLQSTTTLLALQPNISIIATLPVTTTLTSVQNNNIITLNLQSDSAIVLNLPNKTIT